MAALSQNAVADDAMNTPTAFRCALDNRPRMLVIDFGDGLFAAYDTQSCFLYKVWRGRVNLTGTVYDSKHGPRPSARGTILLPATRPSATEPALPEGVVAVAQEPKADDRRHWLGHTLKPGAVTLTYKNGDGRVTEVTLTRAASATAAEFPLTATVSAH